MPIAKAASQLGNVAFLATVTLRASQPHFGPQRSTSSTTTYASVGSRGKGSRGDQNFVEHTFPETELSFILIRTQGCHGLTFPSFSRLRDSSVLIVRKVDNC